jgi:hypothetical protein
MATLTAVQIEATLTLSIPPVMLARLDNLTQRRTAFADFLDFIRLCGPGSKTNSYRPTIRCKAYGPRPKKFEVVEAAENVYLADGWDAAMEALGDPRRAYRG